MADKLFALHHHGMAGVVSALEPNNHIGIFSQKVHDFTFAFITPLSSNNYDIRHV